MSQNHKKLINNLISKYNKKNNVIYLICCFDYLFFWRSKKDKLDKRKNNSKTLLEDW